MGSTITFTDFPVVWSLPAAGLAVLVGAWIAFRVPVWLAATDPATHRLRRLIRLHVLEPWVTVTWIVLLYTVQWLGMLRDDSPLVRSVVVTCPMLILLVPWFPSRITDDARRHLLGLVRMYGIARWGITISMWATFDTIGLVIAMIGTIFLWINMIHLRVAIGDFQQPHVIDSQIVQDKSTS
jgi:hypothetical protein